MHCCSQVSHFFPGLNWCVPVGNVIEGSKPNSDHTGAGQPANLLHSKQECRTVFGELDGYSQFGNKIAEFRDIRKRSDHLASISDEETFSLLPMELII